MDPQDALRRPARRLGEKAWSDPDRLHAAVKAYQSLNSDLPKPLRNLMAGFALWSACTQECAETYWQVKNFAFRRDRSFFWWNALYTSGMADAWPGIVEEINNGGVPQDAIYRGVGGKEGLEKLRRRLGRPDGDRITKVASTHPNTAHYWTKGGTYLRSFGISSVAVLGEVPDWDPNFNRSTMRIGVKGARMIQRELLHQLNPDELTRPELHRQAVSYARVRMGALLRWKNKLPGVRTLRWFFNGHENCHIYWMWGEKKGYISAIGFRGLTKGWVSPRSKMGQRLMKEWALL